MGRRRSRFRPHGLSGPTDPLVEPADLERFRRQSCEAKARYGEYLAQVVAEEQSQRSGETIEAYKCRFAPPGDPHWHIGHPLSPADPSPRRGARRRRSR